MNNTNGIEKKAAVLLIIVAVLFGILCACLPATKKGGPGAETSTQAAPQESASTPQAVPEAQTRAPTTISCSIKQRRLATRPLCKTFPSRGCVGTTPP
jgi:hypothetical protein